MVSSFPCVGFLAIVNSGSFLEIKSFSLSLRSMQTFGGCISVRRSLSTFDVVAATWEEWKFPILSLEQEGVDEGVSDDGSISSVERLKPSIRDMAGVSSWGLPKGSMVVFTSSVRRKSGFFLVTMRRRTGSMPITPPGICSMTTVFSRSLLSGGRNESGIRLPNLM